MLDWQQLRPSQVLLGYRISKRDPAQLAQALFRDSGQESDDLFCDIPMHMLVVRLCLMRDKDTRPGVHLRPKFLAQADKGTRLKCEGLAVTVDAAKNDDRTWTWCWDRGTTHDSEYERAPSGPQPICGRGGDCRAHGPAPHVTR